MHLQVTQSIAIKHCRHTHRVLHTHTRGRITIAEAHVQVADRPSYAALRSQHHHRSDCGSSENTLSRCYMALQINFLVLAVFSIKR